MDKSLIFFILIGIGFLYFVTGFVGDIQEEDDRFRSSEYDKKHQYDKYESVDSIGRSILDLTGTSASVQVKAWSESKLKNEFLDLFPDFSEMKKFVDERIRGEEVKAKLHTKIDEIESSFFSGSLSPEQAKRELGELK